MTDQFPDGYIDSQLQRIPAGRPGDPAELAAALVFLASPARVTSPVRRWWSTAA
jgi:NAD(P)-dependent dehydrogenase (short-subunit alcohol dehydrogenase family)